MTQAKTPNQTTTNILKSDDLKEIIKMIPGYDPYRDAGDCTFDPTITGALRAVNFYPKYLTHVKGDLADKPLHLELWEIAIIANLFGWKRPDGTRRYREAFIYVPRKNGKTTLIAGIPNIMLFSDGEKGAEIYAAAADRDQAAIIWEISKKQIENNKTLLKNCRIYMKSIVVEASGSFYKPISRDANTKHGFNVHCAVVDELHAHKDGELVEVLATSTGSRKQPLIVYITTADYDRESMCNEKYKYACDVRDNGKDRYFLPVIYEAKKDDDWEDREVWKKANPNLGISLEWEYMERAYQKAKASAVYQNSFRRLHLNMKTEQDVRWLDMTRWDSCQFKMENIFDEKSVRGKKCYAGLDLASVSDLCSLSLYFPDGHYLLSISWLPRETAYERQKNDGVPYLAWADEGYIKLTPGNVADYDFIRSDINKLNEFFNIKEIALDRWNSTQIQTQLIGDGFDIVPFGQGFGSLSAPSKEFERLVLAGELKHGGNPVLRWSAGNVTIEMDAAECIKPSKRKSHEKIDPIVAAIMAIGRAIAQGENKKSVYEERGILILEDE